MEGIKVKKLISILLTVFLVATLYGCKKNIPVEEDTTGTTQAAGVTQAAGDANVLQLRRS
jgi:hypothetical protein